MFSFLYTIFDSFLEWIGLKYDESPGLDLIMKESVYENISCDIEYINNRKKYSRFKDIEQIYEIIRNDYNLTIATFHTPLNLLLWFDEKIEEANNQKNVEEKVKLLLLKVEYEKWLDIQKRESHMILKRSLLEESITVDDYIEIMNDTY